MTNANPPDDSELETVVVGSQAELATRMDAVVRLYTSKTSAAKVAGISPEQLSRQLGGRNRPFFDTLARLSLGRGVSLDWVATGEGPMLIKDRILSAPQSAESVDEVILGNLVSGIEVYLSAKDFRPKPDQKSRMIVIFYRILSRWREQLVITGAELPPHLKTAGHPVDIAAHPILSEVIGLID